MMSSADIDRLLQPVGKRVLNRVSSLVQRTARVRNWPLTKIEVRHTRDAEWAHWEYVLVVLIFDCLFDSANRYLWDLYSVLDDWTEALNDTEKDIATKLIFFDVAIGGAVHNE